MGRLQPTGVPYMRDENEQAPDLRGGLASRLVKDVLSTQPRRVSLSVNHR